MPRRSKRGSRRSRAGRLNSPSGIESTEQNAIASGIVRVPFRVIVQVALSTQAIPLALSVSPLSFGGRLAQLASSFSAFRFTKLRVTMVPPHTATFNLCLGYNPYFLESTGPASFAQVLNSLPITTVLGSGQSTPTSMMISRKTLFENAPRWFKMVEGPEPTSLSEQGQIWLGCDTPPGSPTANIVVLLDGVCEYSNPVLTGESLLKNVVSTHLFSRPCPLSQPIPSPDGVAIEERKEAPPTPDLSQALSWSEQTEFEEIVNKVSSLEERNRDMKITLDKILLKLESL